MQRFARDSGVCSVCGHHAAASPPQLDPDTRCFALAPAGMTARGGPPSFESRRRLETLRSVTPAKLEILEQIARP